MREEIGAALAGERLDRVVAMMTGASRSAAAAMVAAGAVLLDGAVESSGSRRLAAGSVVEVTAPPPGPPGPPVGDPTVEFAVVYVDDDVIVVDKPPDLVVHPGGGTRDHTLVNGLLARFPELAHVGEPDRPGIVHRLDRGTSGLMMVARSARAYDDLVRQLAQRSAGRVYLALVHGVPANNHGVVDAPIGRSDRDPTRMAVRADGRPARTRYDVEGAWSSPVPCALVRATLETGRTHQVRVHLAAVGHPVVGDGLYGGGRPGLGAPRPMLHAHRLRFRHPASGDVVEFESPVPADMAAVLAGLSSPVARA